MAQMPSAIKNGTTKTEGSNKCNWQLKPRVAENVTVSTTLRAATKNQGTAQRVAKSHLQWYVAVLTHCSNATSYHTTIITRKAFLCFMGESTAQQCHDGDNGHHTGMVFIIFVIFMSLLGKLFVAISW